MLNRFHACPMTPIHQAEMSCDDLLGAIFDPSRFDPINDTDGRGRSADREFSFESRGIPLTFRAGLGDVARVWPNLQRVLLHSGETAIILHSHASETDDHARGMTAHLPAQIRSLDADSMRVVRTYRLVDRATEVLATIPAAVGERVFWSTGDEGEATHMEESAEVGPPVDDAAMGGAVCAGNGKGPPHLEDTTVLHGLLAALTATTDNDDNVSDDDEDMLSKLFEEDKSSKVLREIECAEATAPYTDWCPDRCGVVLSVEPAKMRFTLAVSSSSIDTSENRHANHRPFECCDMAGIAVSLAVLDARITTKDVCEEFILPLTRASKRSVVDILSDSADLLGDAAPFGAPTAATVFISHAWQCTFAMWSKQSCCGKATTSVRTKLLMR